MPLLIDLRTMFRSFWRYFGHHKKLQELREKDATFPTPQGALVTLYSNTYCISFITHKHSPHTCQNNHLYVHAKAQPRRFSVRACPFRSGPVGANQDQVGTKMPPGGTQNAPSGGRRGLFGAFLDHRGAKMLICWNTRVS